MKPIPPLVLGLVCGTAGLTAGYELALAAEYHRLEHNKDLVRMSHEKVWSERDNTAAARTARESYSPEFVVHDAAGGSSGLEEFIKGLSENRADFPDFVQSNVHERVRGDVAQSSKIAAMRQTD